MILYDSIMFLIETIFITNLGVELINALFNKNTQEALYIIAIYKPPQCKQIISFLF